jgi:O-antigen/teichoic acid export membrane protein
MGGFAGIYLVPLVFGSEFREAGVPLWILFAASTTALPVLVGYGSFSSANSTTYISLFAVIFSAAANIALNFLLIPSWGLKGCAWATLAAYLASVSLHALLLKRALKMPVSWVFPAMIPALAGVIYISCREVPWEALAAGIGSSLLLIYRKKNSLKEAYRTIKALIKRN